MTEEKINEIEQVLGKQWKFSLIMSFVLGLISTGVSFFLLTQRIDEVGMDTFPSVFLDWVALCGFSVFALMFGALLLGWVHFVLKK